MQISPGITHPPSRLCLSDLRRSLPYKYWALMIMAISPGCVASYPLPVRQASALLSASSRFAVARDTLAVQLALPLVGRAEDFHLRVGAPCRAHQTKKPRISVAFLLMAEIARALSLKLKSESSPVHFGDELVFQKKAYLLSALCYLQNKLQSLWGVYAQAA